MMIDADALIAIDWGTTNRRVYRLHRDGQISDRWDDDRGVLAFDRSDYPAELASIRARFGDIPVVMAGMVGSNRGWVETGYADCPAGMDRVRAAVHWIEPDRTAIVAGVCQRLLTAPDVMRGEEMQALGAHSAGLVASDALLCLPGTHCKWLNLTGGRIVRFTTTMTGEFFAMLSQHSILAPLLAGQPAFGNAFIAGVEASLGGQNLLASVFGIRARAAMALPVVDSSSTVSGLLIGADVRALLDRIDKTNSDSRPVTACVIGAPDLSALYAAALQLAGIAAQTLDPDRCFAAGIAAIAWGSE